MIITNIKDSIIKTLKTLYPTHDVFDETNNQGLNEPCFYVRIIENNTTDELNNRFKFTISFDISYFLDENTENMNEQYHQMAEVLYENLNVFEDISGGYLKGLNKRHDIQDNVLHFFIDVNATTKISTTNIYMDSMTSNTNLKG